MEKTIDIDEKSLQEKAIRQLLRAVDLACEIFLDSKVDLKTRQGWFREHTSAVLALNQILKDRQEMGWDEENEENEPALKAFLGGSRPEPLEKLTEIQAVDNIHNIKEVSSAGSSCVGRSFMFASED